MSIGNQIEATVISTFTDLIGHGNIFSRIVAEIERTNAAMPDETGDEKFKKVLADIEIIFDDLLEPIAKNIINLLIELGVAYVKAINPIIGAAADQVGDVIEAQLNK